MRSAIILCLVSLAAAGCASRPAVDTAATQTGAERGAADETVVKDEAVSTARASEEEAEPMRVTLRLTYRQKIPLPEDARLVLSLLPVSAAGADVEPVHTETMALEGRQVPLPIGFAVEDLGDDNDAALRLDISITRPAGETLWTLPDGAQFQAASGLVDLGELRLVPDPSAVVALQELASSDWMIARLKGDALLQTTRATIRFGEDGRISGNASCNAFTGSFKLVAGMLTISPLAMTRKACVPQLMEQETALVSVLQSVSHVHLEPTGLLVLQTEEGERITARQGSS